MPAWVQWNFYGNSLFVWLTGIGIAAVSFAVLLAARRVLSARLERTAAPDSMRRQFAEQVKRANALFLLVVAIDVGAYALELPVPLARLITTITVIALALQAAIWGSALVSAWISRSLARQADADPASTGALSMLRLLGNVAVWAVALLLILDNLGINITSLVAGLGIGGIAIGLATQQILGDLFASLAIMLDKPFAVGDFVIVGDYMGSVEHIGIKTTRIRSLSGEQIVCSNSDLLGSRIRNYKRMYERRVVFTLGVVYQTPQATLAAIPGLLKEIVEGQQQTRFDRAHFSSFGDSALVFEVVYYVLNSEYNVYMDIQQAINLGIVRRLAELHVELAYPTQTVYVAGSGIEPRSVIAP